MASSKKEDKNKKEEKKPNTENDWEGFGYACLNNLIITLVYGLIGANFIFYVALKTVDRTNLKKKNGQPQKLNEYFRVDNEYYNCLANQEDKSCKTSCNNIPYAFYDEIDVKDVAKHTLWNRVTGMIPFVGGGKDGVSAIEVVKDAPNDVAQAPNGAGQVQAPNGAGQEQTPNDAGQVQAPNGASNPQAPASNDEVPSGEASAQAPNGEVSSGDLSKAAAPSSETAQAPLGAGQEQAPNGVGQEQAPNDAGKEQAPNDAGQEQAPNDAGQVQSPNGAAPITKTTGGALSPDEINKNIELARKLQQDDIQKLKLKQDEAALAASKQTSDTSKADTSKADTSTSKAGAGTDTDFDEDCSEVSEEKCTPRKGPIDVSNMWVVGIWYTLIKDWLIESIARTYYTERDKLHSMYGSFTSKKNCGIRSNDTFKMIIGPILSCLIISFSFLIGFFNFFVQSAINNPIFFVVFLIIPIVPILATFIGIEQMFEFLGKFLISPLFDSSTEILNTMSSHSQILILVFTILTISSAYTYLTNEISVPMTVFGAVFSIYTLWTSYSDESSA